MRLVWVGAILWVLAAGAGSANAEIIMSEPTNLGPMINDAYNVQECDFSHDGLQLYFAVWGRPDGFGSGDIYMAQRETLNSPWQEPVNLGPNVNSSGGEIEPSISSDGLELYFGTWDDYIVRVCTRPSKDAPWSSPVKLDPPVGSTEDYPPEGADDSWGPDISADGLSLYFNSTRVGGYGTGSKSNIWMATRATKDNPWSGPVNLGANVNGSGGAWAPSISTDGLTLVFCRGLSNIWATTRKSVDDDWGPAVKLGFNPPAGQWNQFFAPALSPDGSALCFRASLGWGGYGAGDFWEVTFTPIVDFDADGVIGAGDMSIMTNDWHTHRTLCDIAPLPVGDGYVDVKDLLVLTDYLEPGDPTLITHWALDEMEGIVAQDSAGAHHGTLTGTALWHPYTGMIDGALELDGSTFIETGHVLSPSDGPFSVLAWVKGGAPGQAILSQVDGGVDWLCTDPMNGWLMTELEGTGRDKCTLCSDAIIADESWHRIGLVWDGANRSLYVDDAAVASDTQAGGLGDCVGGLNIGCGKDTTAGTFFSGLIDDVRIYNRAVKP